LKTRWKRYRKTLDRCQRKFSETSVHDSRIEARRMISALELLGAFLPQDHLGKARRLLKRHLETFSELRDNQVLLLQVAGLLPQLPGLQGFEKALRKQERRSIKQARRKIKRIDWSKLDRQIKRLRDEVEAQDDRLLRCRSVEAVDAAFAEVARRRERVTAEDTASIHRTRVAFKRFRYMVEGLHGALAGIAVSRLRTMQNYQATMGEIQDIEVLRLNLQQFVRLKAIAPNVAKPWFAEVDRRRQKLIARYLKQAGRLREFWPLGRQASSIPRTAPGPKRRDS
jgi:CHAD domain-containing protein